MAVILGAVLLRERFAGSEYIGQLWLFWLAPIVGGMVAGALARWMYEPDVLIETIVVEERQTA